jgi:membrane protein implicated in regulation of membrane protease activity
MVWWVWILLGIILVGFELLAPGGFYLIFFGFAALAVGALSAIGVADLLWLQWLLFSILAVASLVLFRSRLVNQWKSRGPSYSAIDNLVGELASPLEEIAPGAVGRAELRGTTWTARNVGEESLETGQRCRVQEVDGLLLLIHVERGD